MWLSVACALLFLAGGPYAPVYVASARNPLPIVGSAMLPLQGILIVYSERYVIEDDGVLGMKSMGDHFILESQTVTPIECLHYAMNLPISVVITGCDSLPILEQALQAACSFQPLNQAQVAELLAKTAGVAQEGRYELYKTSHHVDRTYQNPQWLG